MKIKPTQLLMLVSLAFSFSAENEIEYFSVDKVIEYADHLFQNNEFQAALNEYQRAHYMSTNTTEKLQLKSNIGRCYYQLGKFNSAIEVYQSTINDSNDREFSSELRYFISLIYFETEKYSLSEQYLLENTPQIQEAGLLEKNQLLVSVIYILQNKWEKALLLLGGDPLKNSHKALRLNRLIAEIRPYKEKNPMFAAFFSALMPGSGKIYTKNIGDGIFSLFYTGMSGFIAYSEIQKGNTSSLKVLVFGSLSITFYLGNVYGSYISARFYNKKTEDELLVKVKQYIEI